MNYQEHLASGGTPDLEERLDARRGLIYVCPFCQASVHACLLASLAGLPDAFTGGAGWACDGCWSGWHRNMAPMAPGDDFVVQEEWFQAFVERTGRQAGDRDAVLGRAYARELGVIDADLYRLNPASPEAAALLARRAKVVERSTFPGTWDKTTITADGADAAVLTGAPAGTVVEVSGVEHQVEDGDFELAADAPGDYEVAIRHPRYKWQTVVIHAE